MGGEKRGYDADAELKRMQDELVRLQEWVKYKKLKVLIIFEGRDAAGKGGVIKRITEPLNQRGLRVVALPAPTDAEKTQWYFQRYVQHLPSGGEIVVFDRSWYNRAGVERVMGWADDAQVAAFFKDVVWLEESLQKSAGIHLIKYWFSVSDAEQERRFRDRINTPSKSWKLSPMDLYARSRWVEYAKAKDAMFAATDTDASPWNVVPSDDKKAAQLNAIAHLLAQFPGVGDVPSDPIELPERQPAGDYVRPPLETQRIVPQVYKPKKVE